MYCSITRHTLAIYLRARARETQPNGRYERKRQWMARIKCRSVCGTHLPLYNKNAIMHIYSFWKWAFRAGIVWYFISSHFWMRRTPHSFNKQNKQKSRKRVSTRLRTVSSHTRMCPIDACCGAVQKLWKGANVVRVPFKYARVRTLDLSTWPHGLSMEMHAASHTTRSLVGAMRTTREILIDLN